MKEFIEKLIGRLEENFWRTNPTYDEDGYCNDDSEDVIYLDTAIKIVNQLAEEHTKTHDKHTRANTSTDCSKCSKRSWYQKGYADAENKLAEEYKSFGNSEQVNNGWKQNVMERFEKVE